MITGRRRVANTTEVGRWNAELVLEHLYSRESRTNADLARVTGLSRSTVERTLDVLVERGVVSKSEPAALVSGRPAAFYQLRPEFGYLLAIDVGAHTVRVRVDDLAGPGRADHEPEPVRVGVEDTSDKRLAAVEGVVDRALAGVGVTRGQVRAVTVATPGIVDSAGVIKVCRVIRSGDWVGDRLRGWVSERFPGAAVAVDNDANLAALGEQRFGVAGDAADVVAVVAGRRIGFGILRGGVLHRGTHHQAGEAANIRGSSWERASKWLHEHDDAGRLFQAAEAGDPAARVAVGKFAQLLGTAFAEVVHTIDPELIVLGGAISLSGPMILDLVAERFKRACRDTEAPDLLLSTLGRRAVLLGAAEHARRQAFGHLLDDARPHPAVSIADPPTPTVSITDPLPGSPTPTGPRSRQ
ncbi:ROK family transcriptional regulator [Actinocrispum wychmicini]|uniref:ROK family transcriptional regulator n=1 Tax=Actinocrispum wychmicini TaxID=1213861 RepID=UPI00140529BE|nr:ROK family transcriptional regulator [Actinocrispum wychmicini]